MVSAKYLLEMEEDMAEGWCDCQHSELDLGDYYDYVMDQKNH